jgi:hypothetical protein
MISLTNHDSSEVVIIYPDSSVNVYQTVVVDLPPGTPDAGSQAIQSGDLIVGDPQFPGKPWFSPSKIGFSVVNVPFISLQPIQ